MNMWQNGYRYMRELSFFYEQWIKATSSDKIYYYENVFFHINIEI